MSRLSRYATAKNASRVCCNPPGSSSTIWASAFQEHC